MKIGTQNQAFFPENILEKFRYIKEMGFDGFEIDGKLLVNNIEEVKAAIKETGLPPPAVAMTVGLATLSKSVVLMA